MSRIKKQLKKHRLNDQFELNSRVFGLVCSLSFLEIACRLKQRLAIPFLRENDIEWEIKSQKFYAPAYRFYDIQTETNYYLVRNKADSGWLASEYKKVDAFLIETNFEKTFSLNTLKLSKSKFLQLCFPIEVTTLKKTSQHRLDIN